MEDTKADQKVKMIRCEVLFNHNEVMADGLGNTKKQAERNASINGLKWLRDNRLLTDQQVSCSGVGVKKVFDGSKQNQAFDATAFGK